MYQSIKGDSKQPTPKVISLVPVLIESVDKRFGRYEVQYSIQQIDVSQRVLSTEAVDVDTTFILLLRPGQTFPK